MYLDGFARVCYPAEIQEDEDEELVPVEESSRSCYPAEIQGDDDEELIPAEDLPNPLSDGVPDKDTPMQQVTPFDDGGGAFIPQEREQLQERQRKRRKDADHGGCCLNALG